MKAPRWIADALFTWNRNLEIDKAAAALIERLPMEAMAAAGCEAITASTPGNPMGAAIAMVSAMVLVLAEGDPEVVELAELYQAAAKALDAAGVPYAIDRADLYKPLDLAGRIAWLAEQHPTRTELQRVVAEREGAINLAADRSEELARVKIERDRLEEGCIAAGERIATLTAERDHTRLMYDGAGADLDSERKRHQATIDEFATRELELIARAENAEAQCATSDQLAKQRGEELDAIALQLDAAKMDRKPRPAGKKAVHR